MSFAEEHCNDQSTDVVGGKNASLGELINAGVHVPPGFAATTSFYETFLEETGIDTYIKERLVNRDTDDPDATTEASRDIRDAIESESFPGQLDQALSTAWEELLDECETDAIEVAVRSSATAEDLPDASFAGQQDTYLNVGSLPAVKDRVRECMASLFTTRAITYREENGFDHDDVLISVGVQRMVDARSAGVMFTLNPANGDRSKVRIEGNWGLGEAVVSGEVTPDSFLVEKPVEKVVERNISEKRIMTAKTQDGTRPVDVPDNKREEPCLTTGEIKDLTELAKRIEQHYGRPQDIEWAIEGRDNNTTISILQSRPETTWNEEKTESTVNHETSTSGVDRLTDTLLGE